jgi:hypothetical protein
MAFVPEGCLPLKSAIRRFAQARQVSLRSARTEIRAKLHNESISAYALERNTGRMLPIISDSWATDHALRWLKSGTCLLPNEDGKVRITTERFDMFYRAENAPIFVLDNDLQRLIGPASAREKRRRPISDAESRRRFDEWRTSCGDYIPSLTEDYDHMKQFGVSRKRVIDLRNGVGVMKRPRGRPRSELK